MAVRTIKLIVSYDGLEYSGWQFQPDFRTIQGCLQDALRGLCSESIEIHGASRTDAGVSALGQVAYFKIDSPVPAENFVIALNDRLPRDIRVLDSQEAAADFDASRDAKSKLYRYKIFTGKRPNPLNTRNCWCRPYNLNVDAMNEAAQYLIGTHDFKSFASARDDRPDSVRTVTRCEVFADGEFVITEIEANRYLYNMVRNIAGTLVEVGRGRWQPKKIVEILKAKDRTAAGQLAPPEGLCLVRIDY